MLQDLAGRLVELLARFAFDIDAVQLEDALALEDGILVLDHRGQPLGRRYNLLHTDPSVSVGIDQLQGALIECQVFGRAAKHRPEFLVELAQMGDVLARSDVYPDHSAEGAVFPGIAFGLFLCHIRRIDY